MAGYALYAFETPHCVVILRWAPGDEMNPAPVSRLLRLPVATLKFQTYKPVELPYVMLEWKARYDEEHPGWQHREHDISMRGRLSLVPKK